MRVLVGCECSGVVSAAFRALGHEAYSCDIQPYYGASEYGRMHHIQRDIREVYDYIKPDLFICHPPCTYLSNAGACRLFPQKGTMDPERYNFGVAGAQFFEWCLNRPAPMICIENPIPSRVFKLPKPTQIIQPYFFGEPYSKATCLWLRGLPPLQQTNLVRTVKGQWVFVHRSKRLRSQTFDGVALAMADAWGRGDLEGLQYTFGL